MGKAHTLSTNNSVWKIVNDGLSKTLVKALPFWDTFCSFWSVKIRLSVGLGREIENTNTVLSHQQQKRTLDTATNQKRTVHLWRFFISSHFVSLILDFRVRSKKHSLSLACFYSNFAP